MCPSALGVWLYVANSPPIFRGPLHDHMLKGILVLILMYLLAFDLQQNEVVSDYSLGLSYLAFMLADITRNILMTDYSFVSYFLSFFDNSGYRIMCPPYICHWQPK